MINDLFEYGASLFDSVLVVYFITKFNHKSFKNNIFWLPAVIVIFAYTVFSDIFLPGFNTLSTLLFLLLYIIYALLISGKKRIRAVLSAFAFEIILVLLSSAIYMLVSMIVNDFDSAIQGSDNYVRIIYLVVHKVALFAVSKLVLYVFKADETLDVKNGLLSFGFSVTTIIGLASAMYISAIANDGRAQLLVFIITLAFICVNALLYILINQLLKLQENKFKVKLLEDRLAFEHDKYNDASKVWNETRKFQHDIKQHFTVIKGYLDGGEYDDCKAYMQKLVPDERANRIIGSDNKVLDYLINTKLGNLNDTEITVSGSVGDLSDIDDLDLASLLGNILDNAVEATANANKKRIELIFFKENSSRVIICKNTIASSVLKTNKELKSTKRRDGMHGYGTSIIAKIVEKYHGLVEYFEDDGMFGVQLVFPDKRQVVTDNAPL